MKSPSYAYYIFTPARLILSIIYNFVCSVGRAVTWCVCVCVCVEEFLERQKHGSLKASFKDAVTMVSGRAVCVLKNSEEYVLLGYNTV
jgi:hypothetical protein